MTAFDVTPEQAATFDQRFAPLDAAKDALHLVMRAVFAPLPDDARVLCVGAGTGAELLALADARPGWRFTVVEPAEGMMAICRQRVEAAGISARCELHPGYLDTLPPGDPHEVATAILVSHFILEPDERREFYRQIAARLVPGATLVTADLVQDDPAMLDTWMEMMRFTGMDDEALAEYRTRQGRTVALATGDELRRLLEDAGFEAPLRVHQAAMIQAHAARVRR